MSKRPNQDPIVKRNAEVDRKAGELEKIRGYKERLNNDRTTLLKLPEFQRVMADIIERGGMFQSVMTGNSMTYHKSGRQDFTREIWTDMAEADRDTAHELLKPKLGDF
jgi:hypothetical protein